MTNFLYKLFVYTIAILFAVAGIGWLVMNALFGFTVLKAVFYFIIGG